MCESDGDRFFGGLMTADALMVMANGAVLDRAAVVDALAGAPPWQSFELSDARVVPIGTDAAALVYVGRARRDDDEAPFVGAMSSVYRRTADGWRLALYQQTAMITRRS